MALNAGEALAAQGLDESDLQMNRAGRVSEKQVARQVEVQSRGARGAWLLAVVSVVGCGGVAAFALVQRGDGGLAVFMALFGLVMAAIPLGVFYAFRFVDPAKVGASAVTQLATVEVGAFLPAPSRGVYAISLNGQRYSGFARALTRAHLGTRVNAYVVGEHRIVVALEPVD